MFCLCEWFFFLLLLFIKYRHATGKKGANNQRSHYLSRFIFKCFNKNENINLSTKILIQIEFIKQDMISGRAAFDAMIRAMSGLENACSMATMDMHIEIYYSRISHIFILQNKNETFFLFWRHKCCVISTERESPSSNSEKDFPLFRNHKRCRFPHRSKMNIAIIISNRFFIGDLSINLSLKCHRTKKKKKKKTRIHLQ